MRITINQDLKIIQLWVTQKENNSTCFNEKVRKAVASLPNCEKFKTAVLAFFCKFEFSMIKYSVLWAGMAIFWLSCLIVI